MKSAKVGIDRCSEPRQPGAVERGIAPVRMMAVRTGLESFGHNGPPSPLCQRTLQHTDQVRRLRRNAANMIATLCILRCLKKDNDVRRDPDETNAS